MGLISRHSIDAVIEANDIVDVVSSYVRLEKKSALNLFGLCPFHEEKTASFSVSPGKQIFYCFGCQKGGNVIKFIQEIERLSYPEAIRLLADRAGVVIEESEDSKWKERFERQNLAYEAMREAARFFYSVLEGPTGAQARDYLAERSIGRSLYRKYGLGFSPWGRSDLYRALRDKNISDQAMLDGGLIRQAGREDYYDFFHQRVMFPIMDTSGRVLAFGGRAITGDGPKYINSPETYIYQKGKHLFGMPQAVKTSSKYWFLVEGYTDVLALAKAGLDNVTAPLGTALTANQAQAIRRYVNTVHILMDNDQAGREASLRSGEILQKAGLSARYILLDGAKDPDDYLSRYGKERLAVVLQDTLDRSGYRLAILKQDYQADPSIKENEYRDQALDLLAEEPDSTKREIYGGQIARELQISHRAVGEEIERRRGMRTGGKKGRDATGDRLRKVPARMKKLRPSFYSDDEVTLLMMLANNNKTARVRLGIDEKSIAAYTINKEVRAFLSSDPVRAPLGPHDFTAGPMRQIAVQAIEEAREGRLTLAGLHSIVDSILATETEADEKKSRGLALDPDKIHTVIQQQFQEMSGSQLAPEPEREEVIFEQKLSQRRLSGWRREASLLNQKARKLELEGSEEEAGSYYARAADLVTAADTFRMIIQGDNRS